MIGEFEKTKPEHSIYWSFWIYVSMLMLFVGAIVLAVHNPVRNDLAAGTAASVTQPE